MNTAFAFWSSWAILRVVKCERCAKILPKLNTAPAFSRFWVHKVRELCPIFFQIEHSARILERLGNSEGRKVRALREFPSRIKHSALIWSSWVHKV